jgi:hypothetical protein
VPDVLDLIGRDLLEQRPPRRLPPFFLPNLVGEYLLERPARAYLDPFLIAGLCAALALFFLSVHPAFWLLIVLVLAARLGGPTWRLCRDVREDYLLLRYGVVVQAHILGVRPGRDADGQPSGAYVDCVIPITSRRSSVGSVWMPSVDDATRLAATGRVPVICLARAPGAWRLRDGDGPHLRYEPAGR